MGGELFATQWVVLARREGTRRGCFIAHVLFCRFPSRRTNNGPNKCCQLSGWVLQNRDYVGTYMFEKNIDRSLIVETELSSFILGPKFFAGSNCIIARSGYEWWLLKYSSSTREAMDEMRSAKQKCECRKKAWKVKQKCRKREIRKSVEHVRNLRRYSIIKYHAVVKSE